MSQEMSVTWNKDIQELRDKLQLFGTSIGAKYLGSALRKAAEPTYAALKAEVKKRGRVTGNLLRSVKIKVKKYSRTGNAVALIGFGIESRGGGLIEFGTKDRKTKSAFASSFRSKTAGRSGFAIVQNKTNALFVKPSLKPAYPKSFFKRAAAGQVVNLGSTPAYHPIKNAWNNSKSQVEALLVESLTQAFINAGKDLYSNG